jgi:hypothetical protein
VLVLDEALVLDVVVAPVVLLVVSPVVVPSVEPSHPPVVAKRAQRMPRRSFIGAS